MADKAAKPTPGEALAARRYDPNKTPQQEQILLTINGKKVGSIQNLITFTGKQKNGKSRYIGATIAAGLSQTEIFNIRLKTPPGRPKICLFDTEQSDYDFYRQMDQIKRIGNFSSFPKNFDAYNTREDEPLQILKMVDHYLSENPDCAILFLDGILDLLIDFNNVIESKKLTNFFKKITKERNCLLIGVLHRGKGNDMSIGNIGSMADRLAQSVLKVEKNKERGSYQLSAEFMRSDEDFAPVEIWYNTTTNNWEETFAIVETNDSKIRPIKARPGEWEISEHYTLLPQVFTNNDFLSYDQLIDTIREVYATGRNWAVDCVKHLRSEGIIFRHPQGYTTHSQAKLIIK